MNMFARKPKSSNSQVDELNRKKTAGKILDIKKDLNSRLRYLKSFIDSSENINELKQFFDINYSQIYFIFYESFVNVEANIKQKLNKLNQEELQTVLYVFQKILILQPERLHQRWQVRSVGRIIQKLLHLGNSKLIKFYGTRLFLIWYQILNKNRTHVEELMFQKLIQGFDTFHSSVQVGGGILNSSIGIDMLNAEAQKVFNHYDAGSTPNSSSSSNSSISIGRSIYPFELVPIVPVQPNEQQPQSQQQQQQTSQQQSQSTSNQNSIYSLTAEMLRKMLEYMQQDCLTIEWYGDKLQQSQRCYEFLFDEFKRFYLAYMFPNAFILNSVRNTHSTNGNNSINSSSGQQQTISLNVYSNVDLLKLLNDQQMPTFDRPILSTNLQNDERKLTQLHCKEEIIKWLISVLLIDTPSSLQVSSSVSTGGLNSGNTSNLTPSNHSENGSNSAIGNLTGFESVNGHKSSNSSMTSGNFSTVSNNNDNNSVKMSSHDDFNDFESNLFDFPLPVSGSGQSSFSIATNSTSSISSTSTLTNFNATSNGASGSNNINKHLIQKVILSSMTNVNLVHEILRNTYFINFDDYSTVQQVLNAYKKWFLKEAKIPSFMQEPTHFQSSTISLSAIAQISELESPGTLSAIEEDKYSIATSSEYMTTHLNEKFQRATSLSSSLYSSVSNYTHQSTSIEQLTRIGNVKCLQIFFFHSSNLLLNRTNLQRDKIKNVCCYTLEIYKLFIRKLKMDSQTWTLLITILLKVSDFLFNTEFLVNNRSDPATSHLIKLITETILLAIIKASFSFNLNSDIWNQLMILLSTVSSNPDVVDKWIEVIDDLIRQVLKSCYNIDINNLPINSFDQKRKLKKKILYNSNGTPLSAASSSTIQSPQSQTNSSTNLNQTNGVNNNGQMFQQQQQRMNIFSKARSQTHTETNSPSFNASNYAQTPSSNFISTSSIINQSNVTQINNNNPNNSSSSSSNTTLSTSLPLNVQTNPKPEGLSNSATVNGSKASGQPLLNRQRNMVSNDLDSAKSPSLNSEHFLNITENAEQTSKKSPSGSDKGSKLKLNIEQNFPDNLSNFEDDDETFDKSATLKASNNNNENISSPTDSNSIVNSSEKRIDRFNSEKSIYYSSEFVNENISNGNYTAENDSDSISSNNSQLNNNSFTTPPPPVPQTASQLNNTKLSPLQQISQAAPPLPPLLQINSQQPPPLPPLPPSLASKYNLSVKTYQLESDQINKSTNNNNETSNQLNKQMSDMNILTTPVSLTNNKFDGFETANAKNERKIKGASMCSDSESYFNDQPPEIDTNSESMSGGELSGDTFASPAANIVDSVTNLQLGQFDAAINPSSLASSLLIQSSVSKGNNLSNNINESLNSSLFSGNTTETGTGSISGLSNNGLLLIDSRNNDERSASFIDSKLNENQISANTINSAESNFRETAYFLIKRLFGCLGNLNAIKDPVMHKKILEFIFTKWEKLGRIKDELKLNDISQVILPLSHFAPWLFEAIYQLSYNYQHGKLIAYKTLCKMVIRSALSHNPYFSLQTQNTFDSVNNDFMDLFYMTIHQGLRSDDRNVINCIIQNCGTKFWHCMLPSSTILLKDFIDACSFIDGSGPKYDAASVLGCFICFPDYFGDMKLLNKNQTPLNNLSPSKNIIDSNITEDNLTIDFFTKEEIKNLLIQNISNFVDDCANTNSRCVILCSLTCFIYDEILNNNWNHARLNDAIKRIFKDLDSRDQANLILIKMSCDNLRFLSVLANIIFQNEIQYAINIINELNQCLVKLINTKPEVISEDYEKAIISNMLALLEWCLNMPLEQLKDSDRATLLRNNFKLISHIAFTFKSNDSMESEHIHLSAKFIIAHLLNQLNHFPFGLAGPTRIVSSVNETSDTGLNIDELSPILFEQSNIQFFTVNNQFLISFIELPMKNNEKFFNINPKLKTSSTICRFIVRDFCGKNCWDCCLMHSPDENLPNNYFLDIPSFKTDSTMSTETEKLSAESNFDFARLPFLKKDEIPRDIDILDNILKYINISSPECRTDSKKPINIIWDMHPNLNNLLNPDDIKLKISTQLMQETKYSLNQHDQEIKLLQAKKSSIGNQKPEQMRTESQTIQSYFHLCKSFVHQMGLLSWEKRQSFNLLHKSPQLLRELKSLDDQTCRETHKIALIYIAEGQEEKTSILSNENGSQDYEDFLVALAWAVELETHEGFMGGLQHNYQLKTAPYYANSLCEVLFHVSTQMNNQNDQNKISKWRHLGNDSVQIIWSEHTKDYDRNILATEFADVIICIYPLRNGLFRIQITKKPSVGFFGPLFDGAIINKQSLPTLIRATAINASRTLLSNIKGYQDFYVHRTHAISNIIKTLTEKQTSEQFIADIYAPAINQNIFSTNIKKDNQEINFDHSKISF